jgi:L-threonylcarbamoyladenylate synthase
MAKTGTDILKAKSILENGGLVAIPTETVYGLAANATDSKSVAKIFEAKNRPSFDPLIVHTDSVEKIKKYVSSIPDPLALLLETFSPGPITILLGKNGLIPDITTSGLNRVGVRIPNHPLTLQLLKSLEFPLAAPSANPFGYISPTEANHVFAQLGDKIDYILDGGPCQVGVESTIIGLEHDIPTVYRKGGLEIEEIEKLVGKVIVKEHSSSNPEAPGMLKSHYAPKKQMFLLEKDEKITNPKRSGVLLFSNRPIDIPSENQFILSLTGNLREAAQNLFRGLRYLDNLSIDSIYIEMVPEIGLGVAINDRLRRALAKN